MEYLKQFFRSAVSKYFEDVPDDLISFGYDSGMEVRDLRLRTPVINDVLRASDSEARLEFGRIGHMRLLYTPLPGIVTIQIKDLDIRVRPNFTGFALRKVVETLQELGDLQTGEVEGAFSSSGAGGLMERRAFFGSSFSSQGPGFAARPEVHNTSARMVHPCRLPPAPPVVRRAQFVRAPAEAPPLFLKPVHSSACEQIPSCLHTCFQTLAQAPVDCLRGLHAGLSEGSECSATCVRGVPDACGENCQRGPCATGLGEVFLRCMHAVGSLAPDAFDQLDSVQLPSLKFGSSACLQERCGGAVCNKCFSGCEKGCAEGPSATRPSPQEPALAPVLRIRQIPSAPPGNHALVLRPRLVSTGLGGGRENALAAEGLAGGSACPLEARIASSSAPHPLPSLSRSYQATPPFRSSEAYPYSLPPTALSPDAVANGSFANAARFLQPPPSAGQMAYAQRARAAVGQPLLRNSQSLQQQGSRPCEASAESLRPPTAGGALLSSAPTVSFSERISESGSSSVMASAPFRRQGGAAP